MRVLLVCVALAGATVACGSPPKPAPARTKHEIVAAWQDIFDETPDVYAVLRPQAIERDPLFGPLFRTALRSARARSWVSAPTVLEAAQGCDEIILGINKRDDLVMVFRGVPANLDLGKVVDGEGQPIFTLENERSTVHEYTSAAPRDGDVASTFVLPERTWVVALGAARERGRQAFATPMRRPVPRVEGGMLAVVRFGAPFVASFTRHPRLGALAKRLDSATFAVRPGKGGLALTLGYADADAAAFGEMQARKLAGELAAEEPRLAWLKDAKVDRDDHRVTVSTTLPPRLLEDLPKASASDLGL